MNISPCQTVGAEVVEVAGPAAPAVMASEIAVAASDFLIVPQIEKKLIPN